MAWPAVLSRLVSYLRARVTPQHGTAEPPGVSATGGGFWGALTNAAGASPVAAGTGGCCWAPGGHGFGWALHHTQCTTAHNKQAHPQINQASPPVDNLQAHLDALISRLGCQLADLPGAVGPPLGGRGSRILCQG